MRKRKAIIYGLKTKDHPVFYIGSTIKTKAIRLDQHLKQIQTDKHRNKYLANKVKKLGIENIRIVTLCTAPVEDRFTVEYRIINEYRENGTLLTNLQLEPNVRRPYQMKGGIPWPEPEVFLADVRQWIHCPKENYVNNPIVHVIDDYLAEGLYRFFFAQNGLESFMPNYLTPRTAEVLRFEILGSIRYADIIAKGTTPALIRPTIN